jgi:hypothetical protein
MSHLALVCRFFCAVTLPRIFRSVEYSGLGHETSTPSYARFCRGLAAGEETACYLGQHVKRCSVVHWMKAAEQGQWVFTSFLKLCVKSIPCLVQLESLRLYDVPIDLQFIVVLRVLPKLESLSIIRCDFKTLTKNVPCPAGSLTLLNFELFQHLNDDLLAVLSCIVSSSSLRKLRTDNWCFTKALVGQQIDFHIETLMIPISVLDILPVQAFLHQNPNIVDLSIQSVHFNGQYNEFPRPLLNLPTSSLPRLSRLESPACFLADLVPGRPLQSIKVNSRVLDGLQFLNDGLRDGMKTVSELKRSSAGITILQVSQVVYAVPSFHRFFPQLDSLILDIYLSHLPVDVTVSH